LKAKNHLYLNQLDHQVRMQTVLNYILSIGQKHS